MAVSGTTDLAYLYDKLESNWMANSPSMTVAEAEAKLTATASEFGNIRQLAPTAPEYTDIMDPYGLATVPEVSLLTKLAGALQAVRTVRGAETKLSDAGILTPSWTGS